MTDRYYHLVLLLLAGHPIPEPTVRAILDEAGKTTADLLAAVDAARRPAGPASGDPCPHCPGTLRVASSRPAGSRRVQYLACSHCGERAGKCVRPENSIRRRTKRAK